MKFYKMLVETIGLHFKCLGINLTNNAQKTIKTKLENFIKFQW